MKKTIYFNYIFLFIIPARKFCTGRSSGPASSRSEYCNGKAPQRYSCITCVTMKNPKAERVSTSYVMPEPCSKTMNKTVWPTSWNTWPFREPRISLGKVSSPLWKSTEFLSAVTSMLTLHKNETVYNLSDVPTNSESLLDTCLLILHDWSYYLTLEDDEIDAERG